MDVSVLYKRRQQRPRLAGRPSVLGQGLLERARAMSLALLGVTAAVGLAIVALALNQGWPLIAGSSIPPIPPQHQEVGKATVAAPAQPESAGRRVLSPGPLHRSAAPARGGDRGTSGTSPGVGSVPATEFVVSPAAPAKPQGDHAHGSPDQQSPAPDKPAPQAPEAPVVASPPAEPASSVPPASGTAPTTPTAATSEVPANSSSPSSSHGDDHSYDGDDDWGDHGHEWDEDDDGGDHDWGGGHDHDWGHHDHD
jgi:hypothetical protein